MITTCKLLLGVAVAVFAGLTTISTASAEPSETEGADATAASAEGSTSATAGEPTSKASSSSTPRYAESASEDEDEDTMGPPVGSMRLKPLQLSVGTPAARLDVGSEADLLGITSSPAEQAVQMEDWAFNMKGYVRVPMRFSWGSRNDNADGLELHSPPRMVGSSSGGWNYISLAQNPAISIYANAGNPLVSANVIYSANTTTDAGYPNLDSLGGIRQAYLTLKFPDAFGSSGGLALTVGDFSNRYGSAGREQVSSGYYGTYLFGRTHAAQEVLVADIDLTPHWELVLEHGVGAKLDVVPFLGVNAPDADYVQGQSSRAFGSNFLHHAHAALLYDTTWRFAVHYMTEWSSDDRVPSGAERNSRLTVTGAEIHLDDAAFGNAFIGYSRVEAVDILPLMDAIQVLHGGTGRGFKYNYFGDKPRDAVEGPTNDTGSVDTVLFQYVFHLAPWFEELPLGARDIVLAAYGMYNHSTSLIDDPRDTKEVGFQNNVDIRDDKLKYGAEIQFALHKYLSLGARFDDVRPILGTEEYSYQAISPRAIIKTGWKTKEYVIVNYSHFFLGDKAYPGSPYSYLSSKADSNMLMLAAVMSF